VKVLTPEREMELTDMYIRCLRIKNVKDRDQCYIDLWEAYQVLKEHQKNRMEYGY